MEDQEEKVPLLLEPAVEAGEVGLSRKILIESKKLWRIAGPAIFNRLAMYTMNIISQAFAGHLGDLELASFSIACTVILGLVFGLMLGMASALETLCGQAFGTKKHHMLGIYLQRSWIVLVGISILILPVYIYAAQILMFMGQSRDIAEMAGNISLWMLPTHFSFAFQLPLQRFLQCQLKNAVIAYVSAVALVVHIFISWLFVSVLDFGIIGAACTMNFSWWVVVLGQFGYTVFGWCPLTWTGFSKEAFSGLWEFLRLSAASGVMLCLENWYYKVLIVLTGNMKNAEIAVDALSICISINSWEIMIPFAFFAATGVRVSNELGAGNGNAAKFATVVSVVTSSVIGLFFWVVIMAFHDNLALIFTSSTVVIDAVNRLAVLLAFTILLNSIQPILSGVAVGSGWQAYVAYVNVGSYYLIGVPVGVLLGWFFHLGVLGIWAGMIGGTAIQTLILAYMTLRCDWEMEAKKASGRMNREVVSS
ncbi:protein DETOXIFICATION 27-like isoform X2 [Magnolia sinica]|uniref:protein DETOXIFICATION 27-like isoform X2 n=1 Tax=Magnolia sinica TaxID=86752 RepID=UPI00265A32A0|nr:protein DETOXIFICATION 27-like isoform X2 [Magnolia sinica]